MQYFKMFYKLFSLLEIKKIKKFLQKGSETGKLPVMNAGFLHKFSINLSFAP